MKHQQIHVKFSRLGQGSEHFSKLVSLYGFLSQCALGKSKAIAVSQFAMLASALDIVKIGGTIVYSTCALSQLENDDILRKLQQKRGGRYELIRPEFSFGEPTEFGWQVLPDNSGWGPFYLAVIKKIKNGPSF